MVVGAHRAYFIRWSEDICRWQRNRCDMHVSDRLLQFALWGAVLLTVGTAMAAQASPPVQLRIPFVAALTEDQTTLDPAYGHDHCAISGEQALRIERDPS